MKRFLAIAACLLTAACTTTNVKLANSTPSAGAPVAGVATTGAPSAGAPAAPARPVEGSKILIVQPDVQLSIITTGGLLEARADWSNQARDNLGTGLKSSLEGGKGKHVIHVLDPGQAMEGKVGQLLRLHEAVGQSIMVYSYGLMKLPTKKDGFDWTLGDGAREIGAANDADYALFVTARGSWSSGGRKALWLAAAAAGISMPLGGQSMYASLVDLKTGQVVWFNVAQAGPSDDMRTPEGANALVGALLKNAPL